jgi:GT2 family glycosyltransferase
VRRLSDEPAAGVVVPRLVNEDGTPQHSVYRFPSLRLAAVANLLPAAAQRGSVGQRWCLETAEAPAGRQPVDWAIGAVHCIRREALAGELPYDERSFMYVEDLDLCWRLGRRGWTTVYEPDVAVVHAGNVAGSKAWGAERTRRWLDATYDWYQREQGPVRARSYAALNLTGSVVKGAALAAASLAGGPRAPERRQWARALAAAAPVHGGAVLRPDGGSVRPGPEGSQLGG